MNKLIRRREQLLKEVMNASLWVNGSIVESTRKQGDKVSPFYYLSQSMQGKNKTTYISPKHLDLFKEAASEGKKVKKLLTEIGLINIKLLKERGGK